MFVSESQECYNVANYVFTIFNTCIEMQLVLSIQKLWVVQIHMEMAEASLMLEEELTGKMSFSDEFRFRLKCGISNLTYITKQSIPTRGVIDAGRAGLNRARGHGNLQLDTRNRDGMTTDDSVSFPTQDNGEVSENDTDVTAAIDMPTTPYGLHLRRSQNSTTTTRNRQQNNASRGEEAVSPGSNVSDGASIAGLLGLDEEFRIGSRQNGEDQIREVQLRALTRRIMASPSLVLFPARKADIDVM